MRHIIGNTCLLMAGLVFSSLVWAGQDGRNDDLEKLRALQAKVGDAFNKRDFQTLASCFTRDFAITTIDQTTLPSASEIEEYFKKVFNSPDSTVTDLKISPTPDIQARFVDADNGFFYGKDHGIYSLQNGRKVPIDSRWTAMLHRENGEWKIAAFHGGVNFIDNPVLARGETTAKLALLIGFAAGVVLTIVGGGIFLTRKTTKN